MQHSVLMAAFAAALTALSLPVSATETAADREREQADKPLRIESPPPVVEAPTPGESLQAARKPDETPFSKIKILPSF